MSAKNYLKLKSTVAYYNFLRKFAFPSKLRLLAYTFILNSIACSLIFLVGRPSVTQALRGAAFGALAFTIPSLLLDLTITSLLLNKDPLMDLRRSIAISLFSNLLWLLVFGFGILLGAGLETSFYLGAPVALTIRSLVFISMVSSKLPEEVLSIALEPALCLVVGTVALRLNAVKGGLTVILALLFGVGYASLVLRRVEKGGLEKFGFSSLGLLKSFLMAWLNGEASSLEEYLERMGVKKRLKVTTIAFRRKRDKKLKGAIVVSNFHPGPILEVGSSNLPYLIQKEVKAKFNAIAAIPHGVSGHETNLVSQKENRKVVEKVLELLSGGEYGSGVSRLVRVEHKEAKACCQVFNDAPLVALTLSPKDMEDIPPSLNDRLLEAGRSWFKDLAVVDAHNSINEVSELAEPELELLFEAGKLALEKASKEPRKPFKFGGAEVRLDYGPDAGFGYGGATVFLIQVDGQLVSYVTLDGNNMKSGLREKILSKLREIGVDDGEVMTTDTHVVNGRVPAKLGYYPIGGKANEEELIGKIVNGVKAALNDLEEAEVAFNSGEVNVKVLGDSSFRNLVSLIYKFGKDIFSSLIFTVALSEIILLLILNAF